MNITETTKPQDRTFQLTVNEQELVLLQSLFSYISPDDAGLNVYKVWVDLTNALGKPSQSYGNPAGHIVFNDITRKL